jgi:ATP-dependent helicase/nuclease subunit A
MIAPDQDVRERVIEERGITLLVEAGAGTGKTTLLVERTLALLRSGVPLSRIVLITFTRKAAAEMSGRIRRRLTERRDEEWARLALRDFPGAQVGTTDSFCRSLLSDFPLEAGVPPGFQVADGIAQEALRAQAWARHLERCARRSDETYRRLRAAGVKTRALRRLAHAVLANRDLVLAPAADPELPDLLAEVGERIREITSTSEICVDPQDRLLLHVRRLETEWRAAQAVAGTAAERWILDWKSGGRKLAPGNLGAAAAWGGKEGKQRMLDALAALDETLARHLEGRGRRLTSQTARWIEQFRDEYQQLKRERGLLDFQDLALATRDLLKRNEGVRRRIAGRFEAILMDEVQDTDPLQMEIAFLLAARGPTAGDPLAADLVPGKLFLVGDPKQSIYRFRRADIELYDQARTRLSAKGEVLEIRANFRAAAELIEATNRIFRDWMKRDAATAYQASYIDLESTRAGEAGGAPRVSVLLTDPVVERELLEKAQRERLVAPLRAEVEVDAVARAVRHILGLEDGGAPWPVRDPQSGETRPADPGDIAVLVRRIAWGDALAEALRGARIPVSVGAGKRFYAREEIATLLAVLQAIARPESHFAAFAALRSAAFGFPDDSLVLHYLGERCPPELPDPREALALFPTLRRRARAQSLPDFLEEAAAELSLNAVFGFRADGPGRIEALRMLLEAAGSLEEAGVEHLPGFVRWLGEQSAESRADDLGEAEPESRAGVHVLSIHKAKGLEFPIVIVADLGAGKPPDRTLVADRRSGKVEFRLSASHGVETAGFAAAAQRESERERAEEVRLLYVAMTRARDHLLLSWPAAESGILAAEPLTTALGCRPGEAPPADSGVGVLRAATCPPLADGQRLSRVNVERACRIAERAVPREPRDPWPALRERACRCPRILAATTLPSEREPAPAPSFSREEPTGPEFGTLVHRALELYEPGAADGASRAVARAAPHVARALSREQGRAVTFAESTLERAIATLERAAGDAALSPLWSARRLHREVPFLLPCRESFLSGKIDVIAEDEQGALTIYDYKTGAWDPARRRGLERAHRTQALAYGLAVTEIAKRPVHGVRFLFVAAEPVAEIVFPVDAAFLAEARSLVEGVR